MEKESNFYVRIIFLLYLVIILISVLGFLIFFESSKTIEILNNKIVEYEENCFFYEEINNDSVIVLPSDDLVSDLPSGLIIKGVLG